jgi:hypothetical protein
MSNTITDDFDFESYFDEQQVDRAKIRPASQWVDAVVDRFYGEGVESNWVPTGFSKTLGKFDLRPGDCRSGPASTATARRRCCRTSCST